MGKVERLQSFQETARLGARLCRDCLGDVRLHVQGWGATEHMAAAPTSRDTTELGRVRSGYFLAQNGCRVGRHNSKLVLLAD